MFYCRNCKSQVGSGQAKCSTCGVDVVENYEVICSSCDTHNKGGSRFCAFCGGLLPMIKKPVCVICGTQNVPGAKFCSSCGAPMLMNEDTHSELDIIEQRKQKMRADLIEKERLQAVDKEVSKRRQMVAQEELMMRDIIIEREKECDDYINSRAEKLARYKTMLEDADALDTVKLKKLAKGVRAYSQFLAAPFCQLSDSQKQEALFICPVCGAENNLSTKECYACGRNKERSQQLLQKGKIVKIANYGSTNKIRVAPIEKLDLADAEMLKFDELKDDLKPHAFGSKNDNLNLQNNSNYHQGISNNQSYAQGQGQGKGQGFQGAPNSQNFGSANSNQAQFNARQFVVAPGFLGENDCGAYQMPPIVQPVAFVPYVTQDQPVLQYAEGTELTKKAERKNEF